MEALIVQYGYLAVLLGTFLEGETILILGAIAAHLGYLNIFWVMVVGFTGTLIGDQFYFYLGRRHGQAALKKFPHWEARADKVLRLLQRHGTWIILGYRFMYGLRTVGAFVIGASPVSTLKFVVLNIIGAVIWVLTVAGAGYLFGNAVELLIGEIKHYEIVLLITIATIATLIWLVHLYRSRRSLTKQKNHT